MRPKLIAATLALAVAGCGQAADEGAAGAGGSGAAATAEAKAATAAPGALAGEPGFTAAVNCYARLQAVSRLYSAMASIKSGEEQSQLNSLSLDRESAALHYQELAGRLAQELGRSADQLDGALREAEQAIAREESARPFEDFAVWVGGEADRCPPPQA